VDEYLEETWHPESATDATFGALQREGYPVTEEVIREMFAEHAEERDRRGRQS
jgi:hemerythrin-like domain-containing protein